MTIQRIKANYKISQFFLDALLMSLRNRIKIKKKKICIAQTVVAHFLLLSYRVQHFSVLISVRSLQMQNNY